MAGDLVTQDGQIQFGDVLFGETTEYVGDQLTGWDDLPDLDVGSVPMPTQHGAWPGSVLAGVRELEFDFTILPDTLDRFPQLLARLRAATAPTQAERDLVVQLAGARRLMRARVIRRALPADRQYTRGEPSGTIVWQCSDPRRYDVAESLAQTRLPAVEPGLNWQPPTNVIPDPTFNVGINQWVASRSNGATSWDTTRGHLANGAVKLTCTTPDGNLALNLFHKTTVAARKGQTWRMSAWVYHQSADGVRKFNAVERGTLADGTTYTTSGAQVDVPASTWTKVEYTFTITRDNVTGLNPYVYGFLGVAPVSGEWWVADEVELIRLQDGELEWTGGLDWGAAGSSGNTSAVNVGDAPAHPVVEFRGPVVRPSLLQTRTGLRLEYDLTLGDSDVLTIDTAAGTVLLNGSASRLYAATTASKPEQAFTFEPGATDLAFRCDPKFYDPNASVTVRWRNAYW